MPRGDNPHDADGLSNRTRRRFLAATAGVTGTAAFGGIGVARSLTTVEIPEVKRRGETLHTRTVPRKWLRQFQETKQRVDRIAAELEGDPGPVRTVSVGKGHRTVGGLPTHTVKVRVDGEVVPDSVRQLAGDLPMDVVRNSSFSLPSRRAQSSPASCDPPYHGGDCDPMKGGAEVGYDGCWNGTSNTVVEYGDSKYVMTALHVCNDSLGCADGDETGNQITQNGADLGTVEHAWLAWDTALISLDGERSEPIGPTLKDTTGTVIGYEDLASLSTLGAVFYQGCRTDDGLGDVHEVNGHDYTCDEDYGSFEFFTFKSNTDNGDSGGPVYATYDYGDIKLAGQIWDDAGETVNQEPLVAAAPAYEQANLGITFGWN